MTTETKVEAVTRYRLDVDVVGMTIHPIAVSDANGAYVLFAQHQSALDALRGEVERLRAIEAAAQAYFDGYCQDEASDEVDANGRGRWTGCPAYQIRDAAALREALTKVTP